MLSPLVFLLAIGTVSAWSGVLINWSRDTQIWDPHTTAQQNVQFNLPQGFAQSAVKMGGKVYFIGGTDLTGTWQSSVTIFDPMTNSTTSAAPLVNTYTAFGVVTAVLTTTGGHSILVCGLMNVGGNGCEVYKNGTWKITAPPPVSTNSYGKDWSTMTGQGANAYLIGGFVDALTFEYNGNTGTWTTKSPSLTPLSAHATITLDPRNLLVCGGTNYTTPANYSGIIPNDRQCQIYDTGLDKWMMLPESNWLKVARGYFTMLRYSGRIYVLGGESKWDALINTVEVYDPVAHEFHVFPQTLPIKEQGFAAVAIENSM